jgi:hypothetical protein
MQVSKTVTVTTTVISEEFAAMEFAIASQDTMERNAEW